MRLWISLATWINRTQCRLMGHDFYQRIGSCDSDGFPIPEKGCRRCDFSEDLQ